MFIYDKIEFSHIFQTQSKIWTVLRIILLQVYSLSHIFYKANVEYRSKILQSRLSNAKNNADVDDKLISF